MTDTAVTTRPVLSDDELRLIDAWWRAANYLAVGQIYLLDNPLLREPLSADHVKPRLLGHWGTSPGLSFIYVHVNRLIKQRGLNSIFITGPGHGAPAILANTYLEGTYSEVYPNISRDAGGLQRFFRQFSFPGGIPSHVAAETPGSIHEGGELGYALSHAYGAAFDNPELTVFCVIGDGEAETGPLAGSWHGNKFLNPVSDGSVVPILHLNGYKIANPTILARIPNDELADFMRGNGYVPYFVEGSDPAAMHQRMAEVMDDVMDEVQRLRNQARDAAEGFRPLWPMIVLRTPKGWTGPKEVDGVPVEGTFRAHQVPLPAVRTNPEHLKQLESWLRSYHPEQLFTDDGALRPDIAALAPEGELRMSANKHANGGLLLRELDRPDIRDFAVEVAEPGKGRAESTRVLGTYLRAIIEKNRDNFRLFGPDETVSNRLTPVFDVTDRQWMASRIPGDDHLAPEGRVVEVLSEHMCEGWLEGYLLTGRHGLFNCYEAFIHVIDSMFNQHAKWMKVTNEIPWRMPVASLNYLLTSHVWRQDHNGFSHQDPGFIDHVVNKKAAVIRVYLPPDANTLLSVMDHCFTSKQKVNVIVAGKQEQPTYLDMESAILHCTRGAGIWSWAGNEGDRGAGRGSGLCRRRADDGGTRRGGDAARAPAGPARPRRQRGRPHAPATAGRAPQWHARCGVRWPVYDEQARDLRLPRLSLADAPPHVPPHQPSEHPRARLQGGRHNDDAFRHGDDERPRPVPSRHGRHRPRARPAAACRDSEAAYGRHATASPRPHPHVRRGHARDH